MQREPAAARQVLEKAVEIGSKLVKDYPDRDPYRDAFAAALGNLAVSLRQRGQGKAAVGLLKQAIEQEQVAVARSGGLGHFRRMLGVLFRDLADTFTMMGRVTEAAEAARQRRALIPSGPFDLYNDACLLSRSIATTEDPRRRDALAAEAVGALRAAVAAGWDNAVHTSRDPDLDPLRARDDFRAMLADLFDRSFPADPFAK